jgi:hypothetical protein
MAELVFEHCPTCGSLCQVIAAAEGTRRYVLINTPEALRAAVALKHEEGVVIFLALAEFVAATIAAGSPTLFTGGKRPEGWLDQWWDAVQEHLTALERQSPWQQPQEKPREGGVEP